MSTTYVKFTDLTTGAVLLGNGTDGWTPVDSDSFDATLASGFAQAGVKAPDFSLPVADSGVVVAVEAAAAAKNGFQTEVASYDSSGRLTSDYVITVSGVLADTVTEANSNAVHTLTLEVGSYTSQTTTYDPVTGAATTTDGGYSFITKNPLTGSAGTAPSDPTTLSASAGEDASAYPRIETFVALTNNQSALLANNGVVGALAGDHAQNVLPASGNNLLDPAYTGNLFEIENLELSVTDGTKGTTASFSYAAKPDSLSTVLFDAVLGGTPLNQAEIIQRSAASAASGNSAGQVVSDTVLKNVIVTSMTFDLGDDGADGRIYQFQAGAGTFTTSHESTSSAPTTRSFSVVAPAAGAAVAAVADTVGPSNILYQLTVEPYAGASTTTMFSSALFSVTGDGPNKGAFSPLTITFDTAPDASVQAALAVPTNKEFTISELAHGASAAAFDTLTLVVVQPTGSPVITDNGDGTSSYAYTFSVGGVRDSYQTQDPDGSLEPATSTENWSRIVNLSTGQSEIDQTPACYCPGTLILTDRGERPVEALSIGDWLVTAVGERRAIKWIGRRSYLRRFLAANPRLNPIRLQAGCLGDGLPRRDLLVSPEHAMLLDGLLMPARCLVNGRTVRPERPVDRLDYIHVELDSHDVIMAEGAPSETFVDDNSRGMFHNAHEFDLLYPDVALASGGGLYYARRVDSGFELEAVRRRMSDVAAAMALAA